MRVKSRTTFAVLAVGLLLSACGSTASDTSEPVPSPSAAQVEDGAQAPVAVEAIMVPTADGGELDFNSLRGQDVMLWFWAPW